MHMHLLSAAVFFATSYSTFALIGIAPGLSNAVRSGDQFQFTLRGETNVSYIIESSHDLSAWTAVTTNSDPQATRTVIVPATSAQGFWRVRPMASPLFEYAVLAQRPVNLAGTGVIDSFDSGDANYSTNGGYDRAKRKAGGHVASMSRTAQAVNVGHTEIAGAVYTGPGGTVTTSSSGCVGSLAWLNNPANGGMIESGYHRIILRVIFPEAKLPVPFGPPLTPAAGTLGGTNYTYVLNDGDYRINDISLGGTNTMLIAGKARIHVVNTTSVSNTARILIGPEASVEWYAGGAVRLSGGGGINDSGLAKNFSIISLTNAPVSYSGGVPLIGTIYAPLSSVTMIGTTDVIGAIVCNNFTLSGTLGIHYDESLKRDGPFF
jgi:hypothetical protein